MKIKLPNIKIKKIDEPMMLYWSFVPIIALIITTNYIFNSQDKVLGASIADDEVQYFDQNIFDSIKNRNKEYQLQKGGAMTLIFTGATKKQFEVGFPLLKDNNLKAVVSAPTDEVEQIDSKMTWLNLRLLQHQGWEVASQSKRQICDLDKLKVKEIVESELLDSKKELYKQGLYANIYLAPCGIVTKQIQTSVKDVYKSLVTFGILDNSILNYSRYNLVSRTVDNAVTINDVKEWIQNAKSNRQWIILSIPEIGDDDNLINSDLLKGTVDEIVKSKIQVVTIGEILRY
jgi:hypothetical protein